MMTAGMVMAICRKKVMPGALVMVAFPMEKEQTNNPARQFDGLEFTVRTRFQPKPTVKPQFTLYGCESEYGKPYWFLEEQLIVLSEVESCH